MFGGFSSLETFVSLKSNCHLQRPHSSLKVADAPVRGGTGPVVQMATAL